MDNIEHYKDRFYPILDCDAMLDTLGSGRNLRTSGYRLQIHTRYSLRFRYRNTDRLPTDLRTADPMQILPKPGFEVDHEVYGILGADNYRTGSDVSPNDQQCVSRR